MSCPLGAHNGIGRQMPIDKTFVDCSRNTQHIGATWCGSKFNVDDDAFGDDDELPDDELLDDDNSDDNSPTNNF